MQFNKMTEDEMIAMERWPVNPATTYFIKEVQEIKAKQIAEMVNKEDSSYAKAVKAVQLVIDRYNCLLNKND